MHNVDKMTLLTVANGKNGVIKLWSHKVEIEKSSRKRASVFDLPLSDITTIRLSKAGAPDRIGKIQIMARTKTRKGRLQRSVLFSFAQNEVFEALKAAIEKVIKSNIVASTPL